MKFVIGLLVLVITGVGVYFFLMRSQTAVQPTPSGEISCLTGINGNSGDNYCSNYHTPSSKCLPRIENTYTDGCTK